MAIGTGVVLLLMVVLAALALRRNPPRPAEWRGTRVLLIAGGLMLPTAVISALLMFGLRLDEAQWPPGVRAEASQAFHVDVIAHQWWWEVRYPGLAVSGAAMAARPSAASKNEASSEGPARSAADGVRGVEARGSGEGVRDAEALRTINVLHVPAGVPIHLRITASDVIHGFWVPRIAGKLDAVPGRVNRLRLMVDEPGEYAGVCAEYCGEGHAHMPFTLVAHSPDDMSGLLEALREDAQ